MDAGGDLARKTRIRANTISDLYNEFAERVSLEHLDQICKALGCGISDLLVQDSEPSQNMLHKK